MGRATDCNCLCCEDEPTVTCDVIDSINVFDETCDPANYEVVTKDIGSAVVEFANVEQDTESGMPAPAFRLRVRWSQDTPQIFDVTDPTQWVPDALVEGTGAAVAFIRSDGPHFNADDQQRWLTALAVKLNARCREVIECPDNTQGYLSVPVCEDSNGGLGNTFVSCGGEFGCYEQPTIGSPFFTPIEPEAQAKIHCWIYPVVRAAGRVHATNGVMMSREGYYVPNCLPLGPEVRFEYLETINRHYGVTLRALEKSNCWLKLEGEAYPELSANFFNRFRNWEAHPKDFWASSTLQLQDSLVDFDDTVIVRDGRFDFGYYTLPPGTSPNLTDDDDPARSPVQRTFGITPNLAEGSGDVEFGWAIVFAGTEAGDYEIDLEIDNVCLSYQFSDWPTPRGTLTVDEPLDSGVPSGWTNHGASWFWNYGGPPIPVYANWHNDSGQLVVDSSTPFWPGPSQPYGWRDRIYARHSKYIELAAPDRADPNFCVTIEARLWTVRDRDKEWTNTDRAYRHSAPHDALDFNLYRPWEEFGIFIGNCARVGVRFNKFDGTDLGQLYRACFPNGCCDPFAGNNPPGACYPWMTDVSQNCCVLHTGDIYFYGDEAHGQIFHPCTSDPIGPGFFNGPTEYPQPDGGVPQPGMLVRLQITRANPEPSLPNCDGMNVPAYAYPMIARVWVNHREMNFVQQPFHWIGQTSPDYLRVGVFAKAGGRWSDFKCWRTP